LDLSSSRLLAKVMSHSWRGLYALGGLDHNLEAIMCIAEHVHVICIPWIMELLHHIAELLLALMITLNQTGLRADWRRGNAFYYLIHFSGTGIGLALAFALDHCGWGRRVAGNTLAWSGIIVHASHVVTEVPMAWEAISRGAALAALICAQVRLVSMSMHGMGLTLMTE
jgi:hypothetical protein